LTDETIPANFAPMFGQSEPTRGGLERDARLA
jgi:hypothetical protein